MNKKFDELSNVMKQNHLNMYHGESVVTKHTYLGSQIEFCSV